MTVHTCSVSMWVILIQPVEAGDVRTEESGSVFGGLLTTSALLVNVQRLPNEDPRSSCPPKSSLH